MEEDIKNEIELQVRQILAKEVESHRLFLEKQAQWIIRGGGLLAIVAIALFTFFYGRSWGDLVDKMSLDIDSKVIEYRLNQSAREQFEDSMRVYAEHLASELAADPLFRSRIEKAIEESTAKNTSKKIE